MGDMNLLRTTHYFPADDVSVRMLQVLIKLNEWVLSVTVQVHSIFSGMHFCTASKMSFVGKPGFTLI